MSTPEQFEQEMLRFGLTAKRNAVVAVRKAFVTVGRSLARETPADEGTAISNWQPTVEVPATGTIPAHVPGKKGSTRGENAAIVVAEVEAIAELYVGQETPLYLSNNLPYMEKLNAGSSKQAPALFVEAAVARGVAAAKYVRLLDD